MTNRRIAFAASLALLASARETFAAPVPLSELPLVSDTFEPATGVLTSPDVRYSANDYGSYFITALDRPVCFSTDPWSGGSGRTEWGVDGEPFFVERLVEGESPVLERTRVDTRSGHGVMRRLGRARLALVKVAEDKGVIAYACRTAKAVHVIVARGFNASFDAFEPRSDFRACGFATFTLDVSDDSASSAMSRAENLSEARRWVDMPGPDDRPWPDAPSFGINVSLSKVTRDPEPILSVLIRVRDPSPVARN